MNYIELSCYFEEQGENLSEILIAELSEIGFESFVEEEGLLLAYIPKSDFDEAKIASLQILNNGDFSISYNHAEIEEQNWNEVWERNYYEPLIINDELIIRGSFHTDTPKLKYEILIDPKMSFGTGHHETTSLMLKEIFRLDLTEKRVLDMGCGTSLLAIFASMRGANDLWAIDIDEWAYTNSLENIKTNNISNISVFHGEVSLIESQQFDIILANINKNILMADIPSYAPALRKGGLLIVSGFYDVDLEEIKAVTAGCGLRFCRQDECKKWIVAVFEK